MPFNGSGVFTRAMNWVSDAAAGTKIRADRHDTEDNNFASGLSNTICRDGQSIIAADIPWNAKRITNLADPVNAQDALTKKWAQDNLVTGAYVADTPPGAALPGNLWWDSDSGNLFIKFSDGTSTQWVQVNVSAPPGAASAFKRTSFTANSTTFQYDPSTLSAEIEVQGGGGGGGGTTNSGAGLARGGGGGGGGGYVKKLVILNDTIRAATKTIVVGAAGSGGNAVGIVGGTSSYADGTNTLTGIGGSPGSGGAVSTTVMLSVGGAGGIASGGDFSVIGQPGVGGNSFGTSIIGVAANAAAWGGNGGNAFLGGGGLGAGTGNASSNASGAGAAASQGGGGGGGYTINAAGSAAQGGDGGIGRVIITEYR